MKKALSTLRSKLLRRLQFLYPDIEVGALLERVLEKVEEHFTPEVVTEKWSEKDIVLITYGDSVLKEDEKPLTTLKHFLDVKLKEVLTVVHVLPFFPYSSDDGFSVMDFRKVNPDLGSWDDIVALNEKFDLMADLVINHASSKGEWFQNFLQCSGPGHDYIRTESPEVDLSDVVRPRNSPLLTPYETKEGTKHVWTTFSADQVDLDFSNPELLIEMLDIVLMYAKYGARIIRLDAIAFLWKVAGTSSLHLQETHEVVKILRDVLETAYPKTIVLTETNVPNKENLSYFGDNDEADMVYQFSLPPLLLHGLHTANSQYLNEWASTLPDPGDECTFFNFTASHDGIGVRPLEGLLPDSEKKELFQSMLDFGGLINKRATKTGFVPYELNITYFDSLKGTDEGLDEWQVARFIASQTVMLSFKGVPALYIHSLTATPNYYKGVEKTQHNRTINRRKWNVDELNVLLNTDTSHATVFNELIRRIKVRKQQLAFHPKASQEIVRMNRAVFALKRSVESQTILVVANLSSVEQTIDAGFVGGTDLLTYTVYDGSTVVLAPYQTVWLSV